MEFTIKNTKRNHVFVVQDYDLEKNFENESFYEKYGFYNEDRHDFISYYTSMVEYETWCSSKGVEPVYKVLKVTK